MGISFQLPQARSMDRHLLPAPIGQLGKPSTVTLPEAGSVGRHPLPVPTGLLMRLHQNVPCGVIGNADG